VVDLDLILRVQIWREGGGGGSGTPGGVQGGLEMGVAGVGVGGVGVGFWSVFA